MLQLTLIEFLKNEMLAAATDPWTANAWRKNDFVNKMVNMELHISHAAENFVTPQSVGGITLTTVSKLFLADLFRGAEFFATFK